jgi:hypothetical protein
MTCHMATELLLTPRRLFFFWWVRIYLVDLDNARRQELRTTEPPTDGWLDIMIPRWFQPSCSLRLTDFILNSLKKLSSRESLFGLVKF